MKSMECHLAGVDTDPYFKVCLCNPCSNNITFPLKFTHPFLSTKGCLPAVPVKTALAQITHLTLKLHVLFLTLNCDQQCNLTKIVIKKGKSSTHIYCTVVAEVMLHLYLGTQKMHIVCLTSAYKFRIYVL